MKQGNSIAAAAKIGKLTQIPPKMCDRPRPHGRDLLPLMERATIQGRHDAGAERTIGFRLDLGSCGNKSLLPCMKGVVQSL
ncbi:MAG TPA: hypothetical protein PKE03_10785, partial [Bacteroidales bacterium]|nr:hypothetical protein [Bacteroidales bacterium]